MKLLTMEEAAEEVTAGDHRPEQQDLYTREMLFEDVQPGQCASRQASEDTVKEVQSIEYTPKVREEIEIFPVYQPRTHEKD